MSLQVAILTGMYLPGLMSRTVGLQRLNGNSSAIVAVDVETEPSTIVTAQRDRLTRLLCTRHRLLHEFCKQCDMDFCIQAQTSLYIQQDDPTLADLGFSARAN